MEQNENIISKINLLKNIEKDLKTKNQEITNRYNKLKIEKKKLDVSNAKLIFKIDEEKENLMKLKN